MNRTLQKNEPDKESKAGAQRLFPWVLGLAVAVLLIGSWWMSRDAKNERLQFWNQILTILTLVLCVRLVRRASALFQPHVWNDPFAFFLLLIPIVNLSVDVLGIVMPKLGSVFGTDGFGFALMLIDMPVFFCLFFRYMRKKTEKRVPPAALNAILLILTVSHLVLRGAYKYLFPLLVKNGITPPGALWSCAGVYPYVTLAVYLLVAVAFPVTGKLLYTKHTLRKEEAPK